MKMTAKVSSFPRMREHLELPGYSPPLLVSQLWSYTPTANTTGFHKKPLGEMKELFCRTMVKNIRASEMAYIQRYGPLKNRPPLFYDLIRKSIENHEQ